VDALALESIEKHEEYSGKRIYRGLFKSVHGLINADVNGALNILRKVIGNDFINLLDRGLAMNLVKLSVIGLNTL
jgi:transposase